MNKQRLIPYGMADFLSVMTSNKYYVDKTMHIPEIEKTNFVFLVRPRRFGKSLFLNTLDAYYDIFYSKRFEEIFHDTWILKNPTENRGKYLTLCLSFAAVEIEKDSFQDGFNFTVCNQMEYFIWKYKNILPADLIAQVKEAKTTHKKLEMIDIGLRKTNYKLYVLIDEYDNFTNSLLSEFNVDKYNEITHQFGFFKSFFKMLKQLTSTNGSALERLFITGVSPITMDDVTSGFNIGDNLSLAPQLNAAMGFTENEVIKILDYYLPQGTINNSRGEIIDAMKIWYDNYRFAKKQSESVLNTDAVWYFVKEILRHGSMPNDLIDDNLRIDYKNLAKLVYQDQKINGNFTILESIINTGEIHEDIIKSFQYKMITKKENYISLLYFLGMLTFDPDNEYDESRLIIPNQTIRRTIYEYITTILEESFDFSLDRSTFKEHLKNMAYQGEFKPLFEYIAQKLNSCTSLRDYMVKSEHEENIKMFYLGIFSHTNLYIMKSEYEANKGYTDLLLKPFKAYFNGPKQIPYAYLIEYKYIKRDIKDDVLTKEIQQKILEAKEQINKYAIDETLAQELDLFPHGNVTLKKIIIVFHGWEVVYLEEN